MWPWRGLWRAGAKVADGQINLPRSFNPYGSPWGSSWLYVRSRTWVRNIYTVPCNYEGPPLISTCARDQGLFSQTCQHTSGSKCIYCMVIPSSLNHHSRSFSTVIDSPQEIMYRRQPSPTVFQFNANSCLNLYFRAWSSSSCVSRAPPLFATGGRPLTVEMMLMRFDYIINRHERRFREGQVTLSPSAERQSKTTGEEKEETKERKTRKKTTTNS